MLEKKKAFISMSVAFAYIFITTQIHYLNISDEHLSHIRHLVKGLLDMLPLIVWYWFLKISVIQPSVRRYLILGSLCMQFSMFIIYLQTIVVTENIELMALSVIGITLPYFSFPVFSLLATLCLGMPEQYKLPKKYHILVIIMVLIDVLAITNSFHHLFLSFEISENNINRVKTTIQPMCYPAVVFFLTVYVWRILALKKFSGKSGQRTTFTVIFLLILSPIVYHIPYALNGFTPDWEFLGSTQFVFYVEVLIWIICMSTGMVPVNTRHAKIYDVSSLRFEIYDKEGNIVFPFNAEAIGKEDFQKLIENKTLLIGKNQVLHVAPIKKKGYVIWRKDITYINRLIDEEEQLKEQLKEQENELQNELLLANEKEKLLQKKAIYTKIDESLKIDINYLDQQIKKITDQRVIDANAFKTVILRGIYVKRKSNLLILNESNKTVPLSELKLTMDEMLSGLTDIENDAVYLIPLTSMVKTSDIIACLDLLFRVFISEDLKTIHLRLYNENKTDHFALYYDDQSDHKSSVDLTIETYGIKDAIEAGGAV